MQLNNSKHQRFSHQPTDRLDSEIEEGLPWRDPATIVTRMDTSKYGETLHFMYIKYQPILVV